MAKIYSNNITQDLYTVYDFYLIDTTDANNSRQMVYYKNNRTGNKYVKEHDEFTKQFTKEKIAKHGNPT